MNRQTIIACDLFCGAGGGSSAFVAACDELGFDFDLTAINHWDAAIETHSANHPNVRHLCENLECVWPREVVKGGKLHFALFAPECTSHSNAGGGRAKNEQSRATAWHVVRWCEELDIENVLVENVREFLDWGPLYPDDHPDEALRGKPVPELKATYYRDWLQSLKKRGYKCEHRILNAAFFGAATSRERYFLQAKKIRPGKRPRITWPEPTHEERENLWGKPIFRAAREIIDWDVPGESIYARKRPLSEKTMRRILAGLRKFSGLPFIVPNFGEAQGQAPRTHNLQEPLPTITSRGAGNLIQPFLLVYRGDADGRSIDRPLNTVTTTGKHAALIEPEFVSLESFVLGQQSCAAPRSTNEPLPTIATAGAISLLQPFLLKYHGQRREGEDAGSRLYSLAEPLRTIDTSNRFALCEPFIVVYNGTSNASSIQEPLPTVTTKDRFALIDPCMIDVLAIDKGQVVGVLDIRFRMLLSRELSAAMGFPGSYQFAGNDTQVKKQIGNAIEFHVARALIREMLQGYVPKTERKTKRKTQ